MPGKWFPTSFDKPPIPLGPAITYTEFDIPIDASLDLTSSNSIFTMINPVAEPHLGTSVGAVLTRYKFKASKANGTDRFLVIGDGFSLPTRITAEEEDKSILVRVCMEGMIGHGSGAIVRSVAAVMEDYMVRGEDEGFRTGANVARTALAPTTGESVAVVTSSKLPDRGFNMMQLPGTKITRSFMRGTSPFKGGTHVYSHIELDNTYLVGRNYFTSKIDGTDPYFLAGIMIDTTPRAAGFSSEGAKATILLEGSWLDITIAAYNSRIPINDPRAY